MMHEVTTINCRGRLIDLGEPVVMGILNVTPDSFYDGGHYNNDVAVLKKAEQLLTEGAIMLDVGGMSSRPGAEIITEEAELARVVPVVKAILRHFPEAIVSVDTIRSSVARACVEAGAHLINDISGGNLDEKMFETVAELQVPYVLMHMRGTPQTMKTMTQYDDLALDILDYFIQKVGILRGLGVKDIVLDAGFGFAKTIDQNFELLQKLHVFRILELPILAGLSRKSMIWRTLNTTPDDALHGTGILNYIALEQGAKILRVHDAKEAVQTIRLFSKLRENRR